VHVWLSAAVEAVAGSAGVSPGEIELSEADTAILLDLARLAAHEGGERTNAPLLCYLIGLVAGRTGQGLEGLAASVPRLP
jgi:hypothetical protein